MFLYFFSSLFIFFSSNIYSSSILFLEIVDIILEVFIIG